MPYLGSPIFTCCQNLRGSHLPLGSPHLAGYSAPKHERASVSGAHRPPEAASS